MRSFRLPPQLTSYKQLYLTRLANLIAGGGVTDRVHGSTPLSIGLPYRSALITEMRDCHSGRAPVIERPPVGIAELEGVPAAFATSNAWGSVHKFANITPLHESGLLQQNNESTLSPAFEFSILVGARMDQGAYFRMQIIAYGIGADCSGGDGGGGGDGGAADGDTTPGNEGSSDEYGDEESVHEDTDEDSEYGDRSASGVILSQVMQRLAAGSNWHRLIVRVPRCTPSGASYSSLLVNVSGKDVAWWQGYYGAKFAAISLRLVLDGDSIEEECEPV
jgi:hypothetical protein